MNERFLIETVLPIRELSAEARREKAIRHGHISTLHVWWSRKPLVTARAAVLGALLTDDPEVDARFIANLCRWEVHDGDPGGHYLLEQARCRIRKRFSDQPPKVLDSFAGGGSIPLEALRLGAEAYAVEYNPVAYLILKATVEYPQRYGHRLIGEVKRWGEWVLERAKEALAPFYPQVEGETPIAYLWSRTIRCPNPACGAEIPLFRQFWLARKAKKAVALMPCPDPATKQVDFTIVGQGAPIPPHFDPAKGTVARGNAVCLLCHTSADEKYVKAEAQAGRMGHRLVAVVTTRGRGQGRTYRIAAPHDHAAFQNAEAALHNLTQTPSPWAFGLSWIPDEPMDQKNPNIVSGRGYGFRQWGQLFNPRQLLALCTFGKWVREAHRRILQETNDKDFAKAVATYLAFGVDIHANRNSALGSWTPDRENIRSVFAGHHLHMVWDYSESNPISGASGSWDEAVEAPIRYLTRESRIPQAGSAHLGSAAALPFPDKHFDAVVIDPPYADNVPYADLADFFYVWLRRVVGDLYPEAFQTMLTPKDEEAVVNPARFGGKKQGEQIAHKHYQRLMQKSFEEIYRVLKPDGMVVVMFTHRSTEAWERLIQGLLDAGLYPTASFPVHTEMEASTHQRGKGSIQSTILMACRRRPEQASVGWYGQVQAELRRVIPERLEEFWRAGIRGADFFISSIGSAVGVFGRYRKVMRPDGREVTVGDLLEEARGIVSAFALEQLGLARLDEPTRFYVLYRAAYGGEELSFDEANKLAKSVGAELDALGAQYRLVERRGDRVQVPAYAKRLQNEAYRRALQRSVEDGTLARLPEIDRLHLALYLWRCGEQEGLSALLGHVGVLEEDHPLWRTAQAILEVEQNHGSEEVSEEATVLAQLLGSKRTLLRQAEVLRTNAQQLRLFE